MRAAHHRGVPIGEWLLIGLAGVFYVAWGVVWLRSDQNAGWATGIRRAAWSSSRFPRDAPFGFVPGGVGLLLLGVGGAVGREASIAALYAALALAELGLALTWRPPARMKPRWVRDAEARGTRPERMDAWGRGLTALGLVAMPAIAIGSTIMFAAGPPLSLGW